MKLMKYNLEHGLRPTSSLFFHTNIEFAEDFFKLFFFPLIFSDTLVAKFDTFSHEQTFLAWEKLDCLCKFFQIN